MTVELLGEVGWTLIVAGATLLLVVLIARW